MKYLVAIAISQVLWFLLPPDHAAIALSDRVSSPSAAPAPPISLPGCPRKCGGVDIPYPFGIDVRCAWQGFYVVRCNDSFNPPRLYHGGFQVMSIAVESGELRIMTAAARICYSSSTTVAVDATATLYYSFAGSPFLISAASNVFTAIGCNTVAFLRGNDDRGYLTGCITTCTSSGGAAADGEPCMGRGCCQLPSMPSNLTDFLVNWGNDYGNGTVAENPGWKDTPCSYAFVAEKGWYNFSRKDLKGTGRMAFNTQVNETTIPMVIDWAITNNGTCPSPSSNQVAPACISVHSYCVNVTNRQGYRCNCSMGYQGNPYVTGGCTNINECEIWKLNPCGSGSTCHDTDGDYQCKCKFGYKGDGKSDKGCRPIFSAPIVAITATTCAIVLLGLLLWFIRRDQRRRQLRGHFDKNGGQILKSMNINIFTKEQLDKITNNYSTIIGQGAFGGVYVGKIDENQQVAVKRSIVKGEKHHQNDFVNEITIQFRMNHANLVRLVGCCLETDVPMLVFEFISNGCLENVLHGEVNKHVLSLVARLDIAIGSAEALAYMHSQGGNNIVHGDVKSGNILLGDNYMPKVSDFGSSKLISVTRYANWAVMGDLNYIDPIYIKTGRFTEKSDVYSFGVVLLELITRKKAKYDGNNSLPINFVKSYKSGLKRIEMYDQDILSNGYPHYIECVDKVAAMAVQCLKEDVEERPTMTQVVNELKLVKTRVCGV